MGGLESLALAGIHFHKSYEPWMTISNSGRLTLIDPFIIKLVVWLLWLYSSSFSWNIHPDVHELVWFSCGGRHGSIRLELGEDWSAQWASKRELGRGQLVTRLRSIYSKLNVGAQWCWSQSGRFTPSSCSMGKESGINPLYDRQVTATLGIDLHVICLSSFHYHGRLCCRHS